VTNADVARALERIATMLEIEGANTFRVRAHSNAARVIAGHGEAMASLAGTPGALEALPGIGKDIAQKVRDLVATGTTPMYDELRSRIPDEVVGFTELQGLGPKRVKTLFETLGIRDREALEAAAKAGKLRDLPGFGEKVEQNVLKALATASQWAGRMLLARAWPLAHALAERVAAVKGVERVELAGSFRRRRETVGDLDLLACGGDPERVMSAFAEHASVAEVLGRGETKCSVRLKEGLQVDLRLVPKDSFGAALLYFTGSKDHNIELRKLAIERGWSLNEYGLTHGEKVVASRTEEEIYRALDLAWIPPELREARGEVALAREARLPELVELSDLRGDLHMHTTRSDGRDTLDGMLEAARARGYAYVAITEHSKALAMAGGFDAARVRESVRELDEARSRHPGIEVLHGLEVDILGDGALDLDDETLALLDWVIVSIHSKFDMPPEAATARVLRALENPFVHAMGHPSGRLIGSREPVPFDVEQVVEAASRLGVAMEINASPDRLDLSDVNARLARERGCRFVIDTDAHSAAQLDQLRFGVFQARRAGLTAKDVLNTLPLREFNAWRQSRRPSSPPRKRAASASSRGTKRRD
jgi:DNA polymerase (family X)